MLLIAFLIGFPALVALAVAVAPTADLRSQLVRWSAVALAVGSAVLAAAYFRSEPLYFSVGEGLRQLLDLAFMIGGLVVAAVLLFSCRRVKGKEWAIPALIVLQTSLILVAELGPAHPVVENPFYVDGFSLLMVLIIGLVGGLITLYAIRYMRDYHAHANGVADRQPAFFAVVFLFFTAMFGIVLTNHITGLFFFWEITTFCSFWLISYSGTDEAIRNGYRALALNLIGGVCFAAGIVWMTYSPDLRTWELDTLIASGGAVALIPAALIAVAGLTKAAQMPFHSWLLGAMVAPTPVSALLHSSTMVKAGVFILVKLAPVFHGTVPGLLLALIGGVTFLATSLIAINQRNAKLVLAYSTIANLGLIVMCAGVGTTATLWAAILLILFHAVAKALLFLSVGSTEHLIGSRDIEDMEGLVYRQPILAMTLMVGMLGMFLAPFGMLISKYTCFKAFLTVDVFPGGGVLLLVILAFGSAPTLFFWTKWMGKLVAMPRREQPRIGAVPGEESFALLVLTAATYISCVLFPVVDWAFIQPFTHDLMMSGLIPVGDDSTPWETVLMMTLMLGGLFLLPLLFWLRPPKFTPISGYLSGANVAGSASYRGAMGAEREVAARGYYLTTLIDEQRLTRQGVLAAGALTIAMLAGTLA
ncbi:NADH-quinone oxidoreductase subunit L [Thiococcus pfennigii]|uniref:NADH-quinone oxidoreductase subunit 5 family protein n=1 Tax=Thiococcus pfennigii TaxID=1057 RepID=UPI0019082E08|nr:proton-conducting transporter membrane subunit [Thiococcus pfennigii]MBK1733613.1 Na+/H+ antiporter subunit A [Thiococcus pfennigii]